MSQQQYDDYGVLIRPKPSLQQAQVDEYGVPIKKKVNGGASSTTSGIAATQSVSPSNPPSGSPENNSSPTQPVQKPANAPSENYSNPFDFSKGLSDILPAKEKTPILQTTDGAIIPFANSVVPKDALPTVINNLQQKINTKSYTPDDIKSIADASGKSPDVIKTYLDDGAIKGQAMDIKQEMDKGVFDIKNKLNSLNNVFGTQYNADEALSTADGTSKLLQSINANPFVTHQDTAPQIDSKILGNISNTDYSKPMNRDLLAKVNQNLPDNTGIPKPSLSNPLSSLKQPLINHIVDKTVEEGTANGTSKEKQISQIFQRINPKEYSRYTAAKISDSVEIPSVGGVPNAYSLYDNFIRNNKEQDELIETQKAQAELLYNNGLRNLGMQKKAQGVLDNNPDLVTQGNDILGKVDNDVASKYPVLMKQQMVSEVNDLIAKQTGVVEGSETESGHRMERIFGANMVDRIKAMQQLGFFDDPTKKDIALQLINQPEYFADNSLLGGITSSFMQPFKDLGMSTLDAVGLRNSKDFLADRIKQEIFPTDNSNSLDNPLKESVAVTRNIVNTTANLAGMMTIAALTEGVGETAGLSTSVAKNLGAFTSFGMPSFNQSLIDSGNFIDSEPARYLYASMNAVANTFGGKLLDLPKIVRSPMSDVFSKIATGSIEKTLSEDAANELIKKAQPQAVKFLMNYGKNVTEGAATMAYFGAMNSALKLAYGDPNSQPDGIIKNAGHSFLDGLLGMSIMGAFGASADMSKDRNSTYKSAIYNLAVNKDAAKSAFQLGLTDGHYDNNEYNAKVKILNTAVAAKNALDATIADTGINLDQNQKAVYVANKTAENVLRNKAAQDGVTDADKQKYLQQADRLNEQSTQVLDGLKFTPYLQPLYDLHNAEKERDAALEELNNNYTPENEQNFNDKNKVFNDLTTKYFTDNPGNTENVKLQPNETTQTESQIPDTTTEASTSNEAVAGNSQEAATGSDESALINQAKDIVNSGVVNGFSAETLKDAANNKPEDFKNYLSEIAQQAQDDKSVKATVDTYGQPLVDIANKLFPAKNEAATAESVSSPVISDKEEEALYGKKGEPRVKLDFSSKGKNIVEPPKPISEMNSDELYDYSQQVKKALAKQDKEFEGKTDDEKEAAGYYDYVDNVSDLRDTAQRVNFVENSENLDELASSTKSALRDFNKDSPSDESLAILNAAKKKAAEMNIAPEDLIKAVIKKVGNDYKDKDDAEFMMRNYLEKLIPKEQSSKPTNTEENNSTKNVVPTKEEISKYSPEDKKAIRLALVKDDSKAIQEIVDRNRGDNIKLDKTDYRGQHKIVADENSTTLDDMTKGGKLIPDDFYTHPQYYADLRDKASAESVRIIKAVKGKPDAEVTIYRAVPKGVKEINEGDWVSLSKTYAKQHGMHHEDSKLDMPVISKKVKVKDISWDGNDVNEFAYFPKKNIESLDKSEIKTDNGKMPVEQYVSRAKAVLEKLFPKAKFETYDSTADYLDAGGAYGSKGLSRLDSKGNRTIMLDLQEIRDSNSAKTAFHEVIHPIVDEVVGEHPEELVPLWNSLATSMKDVEGFDKVLLHVMNYGAHEYPAAEGITELLTQISEGNISLDDVPATKKSVIIDLLNKIFEKLGLNVRFGDDYDFKSFATDVKKAFETGDAENLKSIVDKKVEENQRAKDNASKISKLLFGSDKADKSGNELSKKINQLRDWGFSEDEIKDSLKEINLSDKEIEDAMKPPTSGNGGGQSSGEDSGNSISHAVMDDFRNQMGFEPFDKGDVLHDADINAKADAALKKGYNIDNLWNKIIAQDYNPNPLETAILKKFKDVIDAEIEKNPSQENLDRALKFTNASDKAGQQAGRALRLRQNVQDFDIVKQPISDFFVTRMRNKGVDAKTITPEQKAEIQKEYSDLKKAHEALQKKLDKLTQADAEKKAKDTVKRMKDKSANAPKKTHADYVQERKSLIEKLKEAKKKAEDNNKDIYTNGFSVTLTPEMIKIISQIAYSHVSEGAQKLQEVSTKVLDEIKDVFDGVTENDVIDVLAGVYSKQPKSKEDVAMQMQKVRQEAKEQSDLAKAKKDANTLKRIKSVYKKKIADLKEDYKKLENGTYTAKEKPSSVKLDREALDLKDQYNSMRKNIQKKIAKDEWNKKSKGQKRIANAKELLNAPRTAMSSTDFSAVLRQAVVPTVSHPLLAAKSLSGMFRDTFSEKKFDRWLFDLKDSPRYEDMQKSGVYISDPHDQKLSNKEEAYMNNFVEKIPIFGTYLVKGSERAYISYLNRMRVELYNLGADVLERNGKLIDTDTDAYKSLGSFVNNMTGRGGVHKSLELATPALSAGIFAPRLIASRLNLLGLSDIGAPLGKKGFYTSLDPDIRKMAIGDMAKFVMFGAATLALTSILGNDDKKKGTSVEYDPRSSDFGKIKVGDTRYDIWGGFQQYVTFFAREFTGATKSTKGIVRELDGKRFGAQTMASVALNFVRGKAAPIPSLLWDYADAGKTIIGDKVEYGKLFDDRPRHLGALNYFGSHLIPMSSGDVYDVLQSGDLSNLIAIPLTLFGVSVQTFNNDKK